ncbi:MAG: gephyrin-like molybdotransferase receptor GlpR [Lawsonella sp.]
MTSTWLIVLLVVVWLLVLVPMLVNTREPIRRTSKAFSETRVLHRGDSKRLSPRRVIRPRPVDQADDAESEAIIEDADGSQERNITMAANTQQDFIQATLPFEEEAPVAEDAITEEIPLTSELISESLDAYEDTAEGAELQDESEDEIVEEDVEKDIVDGLVDDVDEFVDENLGDDTDVTDGVEEVVEVVEVDEAVEALQEEEDLQEGDEESSTDTVDTAEAADGDYGVEAAEAVAYAETASEEEEKKEASGLTGALASIIGSFKKTDRNIPEPAPQMSMDAADIAYAERRRGRGVYDPVADQKNAQKLYRRRRNMFLFLLVLLIPAFTTAIIYGGAVWVAPAVNVVIIALYLAGLRSQVRLEKELRARRMARLRHARRERDEYDERRAEGVDTSFRGQYLLVDTDDGDPIFDHLDTENFMAGYVAEHAEEFTYDENGYLRDRFGKVHLNPDNYPAGTFGERPIPEEEVGAYHQVPQTEYHYQEDERVEYYDPYSGGEYTGGRSVDYWDDAEAAGSVRQFRISPDDDYRNVG